MIKQLLPIMACVIFTAGGCGKSGNDSPGTGPVPAVVKGVTVEHVQTRTVAEYQEAVGTVRAVTEFVLAARIAGSVTEMRVKEGDRVKKGQLLAVLTAEETMAGAAAAEAGVDEGIRALAGARSRKTLADATFQRYQKLFSEQAVTKQEYESRRSEQEIAAQEALRAESRLLQAKENFRAAAARSGYARLTAPFDGVVKVKSVDRGATVFPGTPLMTLEDDSAYRLEVQVPESLKSQVLNGDMIDVSLEGQQMQRAKIVEVLPVIDPVSRSFTVKIALSGKGHRSGAYGRALINIGMTNGIQLPQASVLQRGTLTYVWIVDSGNIARMRLVKPGKISGDRVAVLSGITPGERVAVKGIEMLSDGAKVE